MNTAAAGPRLLKLAEVATLADDAAGNAGAKAARLAQARAAGLPVLPGWVVPVAAGRPPSFCR